MIQPRVSVICPTYGRADRHPNLYAAYLLQTHPDKELLILDDSPTPSPFFTALPDRTVVYRHSTTPLSIGAKRNALCALASGEIIAHFDDDDYYPPIYLEAMAGELGAADLVKLSRWLAWREMDGTLWEWDTTTVDRPHFVVAGSDALSPPIDLRAQLPDPRDFIDKNTWGYGFSFVYRKALWERNPFPDTSAGEDYLFAATARSLSASLTLVARADLPVLHTLHRTSTSRIFAQRKLPPTEWAQRVGAGASAWMVRR